MENLKYFATCATLDELKATYKTLAKANHPDAGGSDEIMAAINAEYDEAVKLLAKGCGPDAARAADEVPEDFRAAVMAIIHLPGLVVELCGCWIWVSGDTYPAKDTLKSSGYTWHHKKRMWYWHPADAAGWHRGRSMDMPAIRAKYGSSILQNSSDRPALA